MLLAYGRGTTCFKRKKHFAVLSRDTKSQWGKEGVLPEVLPEGETEGEKEGGTEGGTEWRAIRSGRSRMGHADHVGPRGPPADVRGATKSTTAGETVS